MWWYRDGQKAPRTPAKAASAPPAAGTPVPGLPLAVAAARVLEGRPTDPDALLVMSLLVDCRIELDDGTATDGMTWLEAERTLVAALAASGPVRLYNRFAKEFGDGYSLRENLPDAHRDALDDLRAAFARVPGVRSIRPRTLRADAAV